MSEDEILKISGALEEYSEHPLGEAIVEAGKERKLVFPKVKDFKSITGKGVSGVIDERKIIYREY